MIHRGTIDVELTPEDARIVGAPVGTTFTIEETPYSYGSERPDGVPTWRGGDGLFEDSATATYAGYNVSPGEIRFVYDLSTFGLLPETRGTVSAVYSVTYVGRIHQVLTSFENVVIDSGCKVVYDDIAEEFEDDYDESAFNVLVKNAKVPGYDCNGYCLNFD